MSGVFGGGGGGGQMTTVKKISDPVASPAPIPEATPAATMGESRAPVTRASTMLSTRRRAGEEPTVGTKKLLGQ
jgi:hypothetical protein